MPTPPSYAPVFWEDQAGNSITEDWAVGFMQAVALRSDAWEPALYDDETAMLLIPIGIIAGLSEPEIGLNDATLSDEFLDELMERAADLLPGCVLGLRAFWMDRADAASPEVARPAASAGIEAARRAFHPSLRRAQ